MVGRKQWQEMQMDCLVEVFSKLGLDDLAVAVPFVCKSWRAAAFHPLCWKKLDFRRLDLLPWSHFCKDFTLQYSLPYFSFSSLLSFAINRGRKSVTQIRFPLKSTALQDLVFASNECPKLRSVSIPVLSSSEEVQISKLVCKWKDLEELELESKPSNFLELAENVSMHCKNFCGLMISSSIREEDAMAMVRYLPKLKRLELRRSYLRKEELLIILNGCRELERLRVKDCIGFDGNEREILAKVSQIKEFKSEGCLLYYEHSYEFDDDFSSGFGLNGFVH